MPSGCREVIDKHNRPRGIADLFERRKLCGAPRMTDPGAGPIGKYLDERHAEQLGHPMGELFAEAVGSARVTARNARHRLGRCGANQLANKRRNRFSRLRDQAWIETSFRFPQRRYASFFSFGAPSVCGDPSDIIALIYRRTIYQRAQQRLLVPGSLGVADRYVEVCIVEIDKSHLCSEVGKACLGIVHAMLLQALCAAPRHVEPAPRHGMTGSGRLKQSFAGTGSHDSVEHKHRVPMVQQGASDNCAGVALPADVALYDPENDMILPHRHQGCVLFTSELRQNRT